jgi:type VI secretion system protein ImpJ
MTMKPRVEWQEGLVVGPVHLQLLEDFHEELVSRRLDALGPATWGALSLGVSTEGGRVTVSFTGVMRDGLYLDDVSASANTDGRPDGTAVYLCVRDKSKSVRFATAEQPEARYQLETRYEAHEWSRPERAVELDVVGQPMVVVRFEPSDLYTCLKVAELRRVGSVYEVVKDYVPPCLRLGASRALVEKLQGLIEVMQRKRDVLSVEANAPITAGTQLRLPRLTAQLELHALGSHFLRLASMAGLLQGARRAAPVSTELDAHPLDLYRELLGLIGGLAAFDTIGATVAWTSLPPFALDDLRGCLDPLFDRARALIDGLGRRFHLALKLAPAGMPRGLGQDFVVELGADGTWRGATDVFVWVKGTGGKSGAHLAHEARQGLIKAFGRKRGSAEGRSDTVTPIEGQTPPNLPDAEEGSIYLRIKPEYWKQALDDGAIVVLAPPGYEVELRAAKA